MTVEVPDWVRTTTILDLPDTWGNVVGMGLAELAAVLHPAKRFDRRGDIVDIDDFSKGLDLWETTGISFSGTTELSSAYRYASQFCAKMTIDATVGNYAYADKKLYAPKEGKIGLYVAIYPHLVFGPLELKFQLATGTQGKHGGIKIDFDAQEIYYLDSANAWVSLGLGWSIYTFSLQYQHIKFVIDTENDVYQRLLFNSLDEEITDHDLYVYDSTGSPALTVSIKWYGNDSTITTNYIGLVVVTQNEPT